MTTSLSKSNSNELNRFVSRGGLKLDGALDACPVSTWRACAASMSGQSTGSFTGCLLQRGASAGGGVDVGHDQLHPSLRSDPRVTYFEGVNARGCQRRQPVLPADNLIVADVSFISLTRVLPQWPALLAPGGRVLSLVETAVWSGRGKRWPWWHRARRVALRRWSKRHP